MLGQSTSRPPRAAFVLGPIGLGYDRGNDRLLVQLEELLEDDADDDADDEIRRRDRGERPRPHPLYVTRSQAPRSATTPTSSSPPAGRSASGAATRSTPTATRARG